MRSAYTILVRKPEGKRSLVRHWRRYEDNIRMDLRVIFWEGVNWIHLDQDRGNLRAVMNTVIYLRVP